MQLEGQVCQAALQVRFDFRFDDAGFFTSNPDRVTVLRAATADVVGRFSDTLLNIPYPAAGDS